jgi:hypothetical protein
LEKKNFLLLLGIETRILEPLAYATYARRAVVDVFRE